MREPTLQMTMEVVRVIVVMRRVVMMIVYQGRKRIGGRSEELTDSNTRSQVDSTKERLRRTSRGWRRQRSDKS